MSFALMIPGLKKAVLDVKKQFESSACGISPPIYYGVKDYTYLPLGSNRQLYYYHNYKYWVCADLNDNWIWSISPNRINSSADYFHQSILVYNDYIYGFAYDESKSYGKCYYFKLNKNGDVVSVVSGRYVEPELFIDVDSSGKIVYRTPLREVIVDFDARSTTPKNRSSYNIPGYYSSTDASGYITPSNYEFLGIAGSINPYVLIGRVDTLSGFIVPVNLSVASRVYCKHNFYNKDLDIVMVHDGDDDYYEPIFYRPSEMSKWIDKMVGLLVEV